MSKAAGIKPFLELVGETLHVRLVGTGVAEEDVVEEHARCRDCKLSVGATRILWMLGLFLLAWLVFVADPGRRFEWWLD